MTTTGPLRHRPGRQLAPIAGTFATLGLFIGIWTVVTPEVESALGAGPGRLGLVLDALERHVREARRREMDVAAVRPSG